MGRTTASISIAAGFLLAATTVTATSAATEPLVTEPRMVGDVGAGKLYVEDAVAVGDDFAFLGTHGRERLSLRWFDAEKERERRLRVVWSGEMPRELAAARGGIIFTGFRERHGTEPWRSDGTRAGTRLIREIHPGRQPMLCASTTVDCGTFPAGSDPQSFVTIGRTTFFAASDPSHGRELWRTDGTRAGTRMVMDIWPGSEPSIDSYTESLVGSRRHLYFVADDGVHGRELWRTHGTRASTRLVRDIGPGDSVPWWGAAPVVAGDYLYFTAEREDEGLELWRTDGSRKRTQLVRDIWPGPRSSAPGDLTAAGDTLYFTAEDPEHGRELWRTDGSRKGTELVTDLSPGRASPTFGELTALKDALYVTAWDPSDELEATGDLWRVADTEAGIEPVSLGDDDPVAVARRWSEYPTAATYDDRLYLTADDGFHGNEVWVIDGSSGSSALVADIRPGPRGSRPEWLTVAADVLYLTAADGVHGRQLWALPLADVAQGQAIR